MLPLGTSQRLCVFCRMISNTGVRSPSEELMTLRISAVAACCWRASFSSLVSAASDRPLRGFAAGATRRAVLALLPLELARAFARPSLRALALLVERFAISAPNPATASYRPKPSFWKGWNGSRGLNSRALAGAHPRQIAGAGTEHRAAVDDGVVKLVEHQAIGGEVGLFDRAVVIAFQRLAQEFVGLALQGVEFLARIDLPHQRDRGEQLFAMQDVEPALVALHIVTQSRDGGAEQGKQQYRAPDIVAVIVHEGAF